MADLIKSTDVAEQLQRIERYKISDEEREQIELRLDMLDGTRDGVIDRSREEIGNNLLKIVKSRASEQKVFWRDFEDLRFVMILAEEKAETPPEPAPTAIEGVSVYASSSYKEKDLIDRIIDGILVFLDGPVLVPEYQGE